MPIESAAKAQKENETITLQNDLLPLTLDVQFSVLILKSTLYFQTAQFLTE